MRSFDFSSWQALLSTFFGLALVTLIGVGIRLLVMQTVQQRRARENRQINERLRTLIAAYKVLGGSFTGNLAVDPRHLRDIRFAAGSAAAAHSDAPADAAAAPAPAPDPQPSLERSRRIRDAVEAALSDIILLGTEAQVRLAANAAADLVAGRPVHTAELVVSLRDFIRQVLDLDPVPAALAIAKQGPARPAAAPRKGDAGTRGGAGQGEAAQRAGSAGGDGAMGAGVGLGLGGGLAARGEQQPEP